MRLFRKYIRSSIATILVIAEFSFAGCKKFVEIPPPVTQLVSASVFNTSAAATSAQLAIYSKMWANNESYNMSQYCGLLGDELKNYSGSAAQVQYYTNNMLAGTSNPNTGCWNNAYNYIYQANAIIENLQNNHNITPPVAQQLTGESKFIRAFWHFYLTNQFGDVPIAITSDYRVTSKLVRSPQAQVYQQIIADLTDAQQLLSVNYVDASDTTVTTERVRPNKAVAQALLARVYLYIKKYDLAEMQATALINNSNYSLCNSLSGPGSMFQKNSTEAIWQLQTPLPATSNTQDAANFILASAPKTRNSTNTTTISTQLLGSFEAGDKRASQWVGLYTSDNGTQYYYPFKYQSFHVSASDLSTVTEYVMVLRLAEQFLIRAEARAQQGNTAGALADLNMIRNRAGLANYGGATDQASLLAAILHERQIELFCEWGHRWYDLNRTGAINMVMGNPGNVYTFKGGTATWNSNLQLFPIPFLEITKNPNLTQNPGY